MPDRPATGRPEGLAAPDRAGGPDPLAGLYAPAVVAAIDGGVRRSAGVPVGPPPPLAGRRRHGGVPAVRLAGSLWAAALTGVVDAVGPRGAEPQVVQWVGGAGGGDEAVSVTLVAGAPWASSVVVRPWKLPGAGTGRR